MGAGLLHAAVVVALALAATTSAADEPNARQATQKFMFKDFEAGALDGLVLEASGGAGCPAPYCEVFQTSVGASGRVVGGGPYPDCAAGYHYHGVLFGMPDPATNGCGWGRVVEFPGFLSQTAQDLAISITTETEATVAAKPQKGLKLVKSAIAGLNEVLPNLFNDLGSATLIHEAKDLDQKAQKVLDKAADKDTSPRDAKKAERKAHDLLEQAMLRKRTVLNALFTD